MACISHAYSRSTGCGKHKQGDNEANQVWVLHVGIDAQTRVHEAHHRHVVFPTRIARLFFCCIILYVQESLFVGYTQHVDLEVNIACPDLGAPVLGPVDGPDVLVAADIRGLGEVLGNLITEAVADDILDGLTLGE